MAIQPIDLQAMYSQMSHISQTVMHEQNGKKLSDSMQQQNVIQQNKELNERVNRSADEETKLLNVREDGSSGGRAFEGKNKKNNNQEENIEEERKNPLEPNLGRHIDITR